MSEFKANKTQDEDCWFQWNDKFDEITFFLMWTYKNSSLIYKDQQCFGLDQGPFG